VKKLKKVWDVVSTVLVVLTVLCAVFLMGSRLLGYRVYAIVSGSMEPELSVGDLVYVKPVDSIYDIQIGDDITFVKDENLTVATHRVVRIDLENQHLYTQGVANNAEDAEPVHYKNVIGEVQFSLPLLGYVSNFVQNPPGMYITVAVGAALIVLVFLPDFLRFRKKKEDGTTAPEQEMLDENARLKTELEELKSQLREQPPKEG